MPFVVLTATTLSIARLAFVVTTAQQKPAAKTPSAAPAGGTVMVVKSATCGCCNSWIQHLRASGFQVESSDVSESRLSAIKIEARVPSELQSCHTAKIGGYVVEGHVPAEDIQRMLKENPAIAGIAVGGMPMGSPGMEQGGTKQPYNVTAFTKDGKQTVFAKR